MYKNLKYGILGKYTTGYQCYDFEFKPVAKPLPEQYYIVYSQNVDNT